MSRSPLRLLQLLILATLWLVSAPAYAVPITYVYSGTGSGTLGDVSFSDVSFTLSAQADTENIALWGSMDLQNTHDSATIMISGLGTHTVLTPSHTWHQLAGDGGLGENLDANWVSLSGGFALGDDWFFYGLDASIGPIVVGEDNIFDVIQFQGVSTSAGPLSFSTIDSLSFSAVVVPEPSSLALLGLGVAGLGARRARSRRPRAHPEVRVRF